MRRTQAQVRLMKFEEVYGRTRSRLLSQAEAAEVLGVSERTGAGAIYEAEGAEGLDRRLGRVSLVLLCSTPASSRPSTSTMKLLAEHAASAAWVRDLAGTWAHGAPRRGAHRASVRAVRFPA